MGQPEPMIRHISDTARWAAVYRARETERPSALFRDPFARRLAGERGEQIAASLRFHDKNEWSWVTRTYLFDSFITRQILEGVDIVVNLAAGLDSRPYRMPLPGSLTWVEIDLPEIIDYKEETLRAEKPVCRLERVRLDLADVGKRRALFDELGRRAKKALIVTEGLLAYLAAEEVATLAEDLSRPRAFESWVLDLVSPGLLRMLQQATHSQFSQGVAPLKFGPGEGPQFFVRYGWSPADVRSVLKTAAGLKRVSFFMRLLALLPENPTRSGSRPWGGVCLLTKAAAAAETKS